MPVIEGRTWLEALGRAECFEHLNDAVVGRVTFVIDGQPEIFPVTFAMDETNIVFRTDPGTKLDHLWDGADVAFEVDSFDIEQRRGQSVIVKGRASRVCEPADLRRLETLDLDPWAYGEKQHWISIRPQIVTGRRIRQVKA